MDWSKAPDIVGVVKGFVAECKIPVCTLIATKTKKSIVPNRGVTKKRIQELFIFGRDDESKKIIAMRELQKRLDDKAPGEYTVKVDKNGLGNQ